MNFNVTIDDFNKICRVCIYYDEKYELISLTTVLKLLKACTSIQIPETEIDQLPQKICEECVKKLEYFYAFKEKCENSDHYLRQILLEAKQQNNEKNSNFLKLESVEVKTEYKSDQESTGHLEDSLNVESEDDYPLNKFINKEINEKNSVPESKNKKESVRRQKLGKKTIYECDECSKTFHYIFQLRKHKYSHNNEKHFACEHCPRSYKSRKSLRCHQLQIHSNRKESKDSDGLNSKFKKYKQLKEGYACDKCGKTFVFPYMVRNHQTVHTDEKLYSCEQCFKQFKRSIQLQQHYNRVHNEELPRDICNICGKTIKRIYMKRHMSSHQINRAFPCPECGKSCGKRSRLSEHMKIAHNQILTVHKYLCTVCGKNVVSPKDLDNHMRVHTGERPYQCQMCEKNYKTSSSLNIHIRFTHKNERPFTCDICFKGFISNQKLSRHKQTHSTSRSYACIVCGKLYGYESVLKSHMKLSHKVFAGINQNS